METDRVFLFLLLKRFGFWIGLRRLYDLMTFTELMIPCYDETILEGWQFDQFDLYVYIAVKLNRSLANSIFTSFFIQY